VERHVRASLGLDDGRRLLFYDTRKFGRFYLVDDLVTFFSSLGPEPLADDFTAARFTTMLGKKHRQIKPLLLDQHFLAGLGNIYVDEALWSARVHPLRSADSLSAGEVKSLHRAIRHVLRKGLRNAGTSLGRGKTNFASIQRHRGGNGNHLKVFRKTGQPCPRCRTVIDRIIVGQRSTHICPACQFMAPER
jgi:formamidopyrimidine-DNA glycosylase